MKIQIIIGSTRPGRVSDRIAKWVASETQGLSGVEAEVVDLADYQLPFLDEAISPQYNPNRQPNAEAQKWLDKLAAADAYVLVTPEYNRSYSAVLKNALDYIDFQFAKKPVALVAHGSTGGAQAVAHLRGVLPGLKSFTTPTATFIIGRAGELFDETGKLNEAARSNPMSPQATIKTTLEELVWYAQAFSAARAQTAEQANP